MKTEGTLHQVMSRKRRDKFGAPTGKQLQVADKSRVMPEHQVIGMINAILAGQDVEETVDAVVSEIREGQGGGPYPIGSSVKLNQPWVGMDTAGKPVSLSKGDIVTILMPNLGEQGQDKMVLLPGGADKAVLPLDILGEAVLEGHSDGGFAGVGGDTTDPKKGPSGYKVPPATGPTGGMKHGKAQGMAPQPKDVALPEPKGMTTPSSNPSVPQGQAKPKDDPAAQKTGSKAPSSHPSVTVEDVAGMFEQLLDETPDPILYRRISELARSVFDIDDENLYAIVAEALKPDNSIHLRDLEWMFEQSDNEFMTDMNNKERKEYGAMSPSERKKYRKQYAYRKKFRKMYGEEVDEASPAELRKQLQGMKKKGTLKGGKYKGESVDEVSPEELRKELRAKMLKKKRCKY